MMVDSLSLLLNGLRAISVRLSIPWKGAWTAEVELDLDAPEVTAPLLAAETPAVLIVGGSSFVGTIDPSGSSTFAGKATARVVGGRNGWSKTVPAQHFHNPAGILPSQMVYLATGGLVGEIVADSAPTNFGTDFVRNAGPASSVFHQRNWYVDPTTGTTLVAGWLPAINPDIQILDWVPVEQRAILTSDSVVVPGTTLADTRFGVTTYTVRDVEMNFTREGMAAFAWCSSNPGSRLTGALESMVREFGNTRYLGFYKYRFVLPVGAEMGLQAVTAGAPDLILGSTLAALPSSTPLFTPGVEVIVGFLGGDPAQPFIVSPTELQMALLTFCLDPPLTALTVTASAAALAAKLATIGNNQ